MFIDETVIAGVITVGLMIAFLSGFAVFIWRDSQKQGKASRRP
ncbi:hypothetical protein SAMN05216421_1989 [Halopseudomonas xinjiangensis]|uniref:ATP-dependent helicase n=1 Tax=Halopseudomonas xinjiangensis TaxID=487184 RepID=A0A1H1U8Q0_9GAMM|nr:hypothetical protein SAMN05216421_1989 [Halopseudomonas xinjiangensis]